MSEINRRNTESVFAQLKDMDERVRTQQLMIETLNKVFADLSDRLLMVERKLIEQRIKTMGSGPTEQ